VEENECEDQETSILAYEGGEEKDPILGVRLLWKRRLPR